MSAASLPWGDTPPVPAPASAATPRPPEPTPLPPPGLPSRYRLGECLGRGGAGSVYAAWDEPLARPVAIKQVLHQAGMDGLREAQLTAGLNHPAFVAVYEAWGDAAQSFIVMERVPGQTLKAHLAEHGPASLAQACDWMQQLAQAMAAAHAQGLVHGDLKPSNLMLQPTEAGTGQRLRVLDLGIARLIDPLATLSQANVASLTGSAGTLAYMAPEQLRGQGPSVATDIYALGLVLLAVLHGASSDTGSPSLSLAWRRLQGDPGHDLAQPHWPAPLNRLLAWLLAPDPAQRPADMGQVAQALGHLRDALRQPGGEALAVAPVRAGPVGPTDHAPTVTSSVAPATPPSPLPLAAPPASRWPAWARGALAAGGLMLGLTLLWAVQQAGGLGRPLRSTATHPAAGAAPSAVAAAPRPSATLPPPAAWMQTQLAQAETWLRDYDDPDSLSRAQTLLQELTERAPRHATAAALRGLAYGLRYSQQEGDKAALAEAGRWADKALGLDSQLAVAHVAKGLYWNLYGDKRSAETAFQQALLLNPQDLHAMVWLADMFFSQERLAEAQTLLAQARQAHPSERLVFDMLGHLNFKRADYAAAEAAFRRSLQLHPTGSVAALSLSGVLLSQQRLDEAQVVLQQGLAVRPDHRLYSNLGLVLAQRGRWAEAVAAQRRALATWPAGQPDVPVQANLAEALARLPGHQAEAQAAWGRALASAQAQWAQQTHNPQLASQVGWFAAQVGQADLARQATQQALALAPQSPYVLYQAAIAWALLGERARARMVLNQALARGYPAHVAAQEPALAGLLPAATLHSPPARPAPASSHPLPTRTPAP